MYNKALIFLLAASTTFGAVIYPPGQGSGSGNTNAVIHGGQTGTVQTNGVGEWTIKSIADSAGKGTNTSHYGITAFFSNIVVHVGNLIGNGNGLTNTLPTHAVAFSTNAPTAIFNTNDLFLNENFPISTNAISASGSFPASGRFIFTNSGPIGLNYWFTPSNTPTAPIAVIYVTNVSAGKIVMVLNDLQDGAIEAMWATNDLVFYPDGAMIDSVLSLGTLITNRVTGTFPVNTIANKAGIANEALRIHERVHTPGISGVPFAWVYTGNSNDKDLTNVVNYAATNLKGYARAILLERWTVTRDVNGVQVLGPSSSFSQGTIKTLADYVHAAGFPFFVHTDAGIFGYQIVNAGTGSFPYYEKDATNLLASTVDGALIDCTSPFATGELEPRDHVLEFIREFRTASLRYSRPFFVFAALNGRYPSKPEDWMVTANSFWTEADAPTTTEYLRMMRKTQGWNGRGTYICLANPGTDHNASVNQARQYYSMLSIAPAYSQTDTNFFTASVNTVRATQAMLDIWRDSLGSGGFLVSSNNLGEVWARFLCDGSVAVAFINTGTAGTMSINWSSIPQETNTTYLCTDVFEGTNISKTISLSRSMAANEGSLWKLSRGTSLTPWTSDINANEFGLTNVSELSFSSLNGTNSIIEVFGAIAISNGVTGRKMTMAPSGLVTADVVYMPTNTAPLKLTTDPTNQFVEAVLYTNWNQRSLLSGSMWMFIPQQQNAHFEVYISYTNSDGIGHRLTWYENANLTNPNDGITRFIPFSLMLDPLATWKATFYTTGTATGGITNVVNAGL